MEEVVRHTCRLHPGAQAERALLAEWHRCRRNEAVHQEKSGNKPILAKLGKLLTEARRRCGWLREGSQVAPQQTLRTYAQALTHSFTVPGRGRPTLKHRKDTLPSLAYTTRGFSLREGRLILPKGVSIPVIWSRDCRPSRGRCGSTRTVSGIGMPRSWCAARAHPCRRPPAASGSTGVCPPPRPPPTRATISRISGTAHAVPPRSPRRSGRWPAANGRGAWLRRRATFGPSGSAPNCRRRRLGSTRTML